MSWTWTTLRAALDRLALPEGDAVVGLAGALLANESVDGVARVELLVEDRLRDDLLRRGWAVDEASGWLVSGAEPDLLVRADDVSDTYTAPIPTLIADAWTQDGVPLVSMLRVRESAVRELVEEAQADGQPDPSLFLSWTWQHLVSVLERLALPHDQYVVGPAGALLANESVERVAEIELLVTGDLHDELARDGWYADGARPRLLCPFEDDLFARADEVFEICLAPVPELLSEAWHHDGVPCVSMLQVRRDVVEALVLNAAHER